MQTVQVQLGGDAELEKLRAELEKLRAENEQLRAEADALQQENSTLRKNLIRAKDASPVERPTFKRVQQLAQNACMRLEKLGNAWILKLGNLWRKFKKLSEVWEVIAVDDWYVDDIFHPSKLFVHPYQALLIEKGEIRFKAKSKPPKPPHRENKVSPPVPTEHWYSLQKQGFFGGLNSG